MISIAPPRGCTIVENAPASRSAGSSTTSVNTATGSQLSPAATSFQRSCRSSDREPESRQHRFQFLYGIGGSNLYAVAEHLARQCTPSSALLDVAQHFGGDRVRKRWVVHAMNLCEWLQHTRGAPGPDS